MVRRHPDTGERRLDALAGGLIPAFEEDDLKAARKPINARSETVSTAAMFRSSFTSRRCLVPADAFYEWRAQANGKQPFAFARQDGAPLTFAGLWKGWRGPEGEVRRTFAILTTAANATMAPVNYSGRALVGWVVLSGDGRGLMLPLAQQRIVYIGSLILLGAKMMETVLTS